MSSIARAKGATLLLSVPLLGFLTGCGGGSPNQAPEMQAMPVQVAPVLTREVALTQVFTGRFEPVEEVELRPRVSGYIKEVRFEEGQKVEEGDLMFQIDPDPFDAIVAAAEARVQQATARRDLAQGNLDRVEDLEEGRAVSKEEVAIRQSELAQAEADIAVAEAELRAAELDRGFADVRAPISGIADDFEITRGNFVSGGTIASTVLTTIVPHDPIHCVFEVDERRLLEFTRMYFEGMAPGRDGEPIPVEIAVSDSEEFEFLGRIDFAENQLDRETATIQMRALVENPDEFLTPGLFARVRLPVGAPFEARLVRDSALGFDQDKRFAWVLGEGNSVKRRFVETGERQGLFRIIESGLAPEEKIVVSGIQLLQDGMVVSPTVVAMDPDAPDSAGEAASEEAVPESEDEPR